jgi:GAF domain-containing protein
MTGQANHYRLLAAISRLFIHHDLETAQEQALQELGTALGVECAHWYRCCDGDRVERVCYWHAKSVAPPARLPDRMSQRLLERAPCRVECLADWLVDLPPAAAVVRSLLVAPVKCGSQVLGMICLSTVSAGRSWTDEEADVVELVGESAGIA